MSSLPAMRTDRELLADYAATGSEAAFAEIASRHGRMVYRTCLRLIGNAHDAEEAAQAAFLVLVRRRRSLRSEGELGAWLHRVALNTAHLALRGRARRSRHEEAAAMARQTGEPDEVAPGGGPAVGNLDAELDRLPAAQRQAVVLRYLEGLSQDQAARAVGCPQGTLARRAQMGLERLRERLCQRGCVLAMPGLVALLGAEAGAAVPESLLPSILAVPKLAAAGVAAGAAGSVGAGAGASLLADGVLKMLFWAKVKIAAAVIGAVLVAGGAGGVVANRMLAGEPAAGPTAPKPQAAPADAAGEAVNGIRLRIGIAPRLICGEKCSAESRRGAVMNGIHKCTTCATMCMLTAKHCAKCAESRGVCMICGAKVEQPAAFEVGQPLPVRAGFENVSEKDELIYMWDLSCAHAHKCYTLVFTDLKTGRKYEKREVQHEPWKEEPWHFGLRRGTRDWSRTFRDAKMETGGGRLGAGEYSLQVVYSNDDDGAKYPRLGEAVGKIWTGIVRSNTIRIVLRDGVGQKPAPEAVNGLKLTISADKLEPKAGDAVNIDLAFENVSKESMHILKFDYLAVSWELVAPDGQSLAAAPTAMPGLMPPGAKDYPELKAGAKLSWRGKTISGNPPSIYVGPAVNYRNVYLLKPGTYKLTAVYKLPEGQGKGVAPGKVWAGTLRSNTLEIKFGGEFKAAGKPGGWGAPADIPGVTFAH